jgi:PelA/Pel-15E family pectate lyase
LKLPAGQPRLTRQPMKFPTTLFCSAVLLTAGLNHAAIIGTNVPATPLTAERVANLPEWKNYFENSQRQKAADQSFFRDELNSHGLTNATLPHAVHNAKGVALDNFSPWYRGGEAHRIASNVVSFQTPAGGWSKNTDFTKNPRQPGELFGVENVSDHTALSDFDRPDDLHWNYVGTFDNDSTTTELRFLAKVISANKNDPAANDYKKSFERGLDYVFNAQFPSGGWPQVWPLQGGYHDEITLNDDAMLHVVEFMRDVSLGRDEFSFVSPELRAKAEASWKRGLDCILASQIKVDGKLTAWCQQHDAISLQPASARNYEMPSLASEESASIVLFLMQLPDPDAKSVAAVHAACAWFEKTKIIGKKFTGTGAEGKKLVDAPGNGPIWSRCYEIGTDRPIFGDRDKSIHDDVNEISRERRKGYGWYRDTPKRALEHYKKWAKEHPQA